MDSEHECEYCEKHYEHGGECFGIRKSRSIPCLGFKQDSRGNIKYEQDQEMTFKANSNFPIIGKWTEDYSLDDNDTPMKFTKITPLRWITERAIAIECQISFYYYDNSDYEDQGEKKMAEVIPIKRKGGIT